MRKLIFKRVKGKQNGRQTVYSVSYINAKNDSCSCGRLVWCKLCLPRRPFWSHRLTITVRRLGKDGKLLPKEMLSAYLPISISSSLLSPRSLYMTIVRTYENKILCWSGASMVTQYGAIRCHSHITLSHPPYTVCIKFIPPGLCCSFTLFACGSYGLKEGAAAAAARCEYCNALVKHGNIWICMYVWSVSGVLGVRYKGKGSCALYGIFYCV